MDSDAPPTARPRLFPTTHWTLILSARGRTEARRTAVADLLPRYWRPLYFYARRKGLSVDRAEDAVQGFLLRLIESDFLAALEPDKGRFRSYLLRGFNNFLASEHERETAAKRGGGAVPVAIDLDLERVAAERGLAEAAAGSPEDAFTREWATGVMERALGQLRSEIGRGQRPADEETMLRFFALGAAPSYAEAAAACGVSVPLFKARLHRTRLRFRALVKAEVAVTVAPGSDVDAEVRELVRVLSS